MKLRPDIDDVVAELFTRFPMLVGFSIAERGEQCVAELTMLPSAEGGLAEEIALPLAELIEESPGARELLAGRTFTRTLH